MDDFAWNRTVKLAPEERNRLRGTDEQGIRNTFNDSLLGFYEMAQGDCTDEGGNQLFIFWPGYRTPPHEAQSFISWGESLQSLFPRYG
jgi:hypothetical protein